MKVLVIGSSDQASDLLHALSSPSGVTHCQTLQSAQQEVEHGHANYRWVFVEEAHAPQSREFLDALREREPDTVVFKVSRTDEAAATPGTVPICAVETTENGMQILRCALRCAARNPQTDPALRTALSDRPLVFEYHAERKAG